jgi:GDP-mannose 6-dehydrogenase
LLVENSQDKLNLLRAGKSPVSEPGLDEKLSRGLRSGQVEPIESAGEAVSKSELALVCVGTPSEPGGSADTTLVRRVLREIGDFAVHRAGAYVIALRSTVPSSQVFRELIPTLAECLKDRFGKDIVFALNPEFLREGNGIEDFCHPPFVVVGTDHRLAAESLKELYRKVPAPFFTVSLGTASLLKYACNAFHAVKVTFANEIASLEKAFSADADSVMEIFCLDTTLNISPAYLAPGYAIGGSCLPKDLRALSRIASAFGVSCPLLDSILSSNEKMVQRSIDAVVRLGIRDVTLVGLSFKLATDDLRESPLVELAERLLGKGYRVRIFDPDVRLDSLQGQNLQYVEKHLEHLASLLSDKLEEALKGSQLVVVGKSLPVTKDLGSLCSPGTVVLDLVRCLPLELPPLRIMRLNGTPS